ncbi:N-acetyltransferase [Cellulosimicrobium sp. PMB13]|uniref:GNAT family N-acetyltransferase n=1 Tax=Cellulosimicrobium sp. PMB13 TaxID=3120158 RepID=UPI003F4B16AB
MVAELRAALLDADLSARPTLRELTDDDVAAVVALDREAFGDDAWAEEVYLRREDWGCLLIVAERVGRDGGSVLWGYVGIEPRGERCGVASLAVAKDVRRHGIGSRLLGVALDVARRAGAASVDLEVHPSNSVAIEFYGKHGFEPFGSVADYYGVDGGSALLMRHELHRMDVAAEH